MTFDSAKYMWTVRPVDDGAPTAPFVVWSSEDGKVYSDLDGVRYELVNPSSSAPVRRCEVRHDYYEAAFCDRPDGHDGPHRGEGYTSHRREWYTPH